MTKLKAQWVAGIAVSTLVVAMAMGTVFADDGHGKKGHGGHDQEEQEDHSGHYVKHLLKHAKEIGLTSEQVGKLKAIQLDFKRSEARLEADAKVANLELHALLEDEKADLNVIQAKVEQLKNAESACLFAAIKSKRTAMALLSSDQRDKERAVHEQMKSSGQHGAGGSGTGHGGMMGGMMGSMGSGSHGSGGASGGQQHQH